MLRFWSCLVVVVVSGVGVLAWETLRDDEDAQRLARGQELLASGRYADAVKALKEIRTSPTRSETALAARLLISRALRLGGKPADAADVARRLWESLPDDHAARGRARFLLADAVEALGKGDEAARLWGAEAARILGSGHKARIAGYYLALAERYEAGRKATDPLDHGVPADPKRAASLRLSGLKLLTGGTPLARVTIPRARNLLAAKQPAPATRELKALLDAAEAKDATARGRGLTPVEEAEARFLRARGLHAQGLPALAVGEVARLLALPSVAETKFAALGRKLEGDVLLARGGADAVRSGVAAWRRFLADHADHADASDVRSRIAAALFGAGESAKAIPALEAVAADAKASRPSRAQALFQIAECRRRLAEFDAAREAARRYLAAYPDDANVPRAQALLPELLLEKARRLRASKDAPGAVGALRQYVDEYPLSGQAARVAVEVGLVLRAEKDSGGAAKAFRSARDRYARHDPQQAARAGVLLGIVAEEDDKDLEVAAKAYRDVVKRFRSTSAAAHARKRLAQLERIELSVQSPRIFNPDESASVKLTVRNVAEVDVRLYKLDARKVFERRGTLEGVNGIEVALVKADRSFKLPVADYTRYRQDRFPVALELAEGKGLPEGAWLCSVQAKERRSVVLVIVSSLRLIVKESPYEVFCWAIDGKTGEPVEGADVMVRGKGVKADLKTGPDGVARLVHDAAKGRCAVFGSRGDSIAPGLAKAPPAAGKAGLAPRAAFTLDAPVYRPGGAVRWHAVVRDVSRGLFVTPRKGAKALAALIDARGRRIGSADVVIGEYGAVNGSFEVPSEGAVGDWTISLEYGKHVFTETVPVQEYKKPEYVVDVKASQPVVRPGEEVDVGVGVSYFFGGPVREAAFEWRVWRARTTVDRTRYLSHAWFLQAVRADRGAKPERGMNFVASGAGSTDAKGQGRLTFRTPVEPGPWRYVVQVLCKDTTGQWVAGNGVAFSGPTDRFAVALADQRTYRAGDTAELRVVTRTLGHAAAATRGRARALIVRRGADGKTSLDRVADLEVDTGLSGEAKIRLPLKEAGDYVLRFEGTDAHGAPVSDETRVVVSGDRPDLAKEAHLRFEKAAYRGGETARMHLSLPAAGRAVLVTFEGERILEHRILRPARKSAVHELVLGASLAPNITVACAFQHDGKLLTSEDEVVVLRYLQVEVKTDRTTARPGDKISVDVVTRDQQGRPVGAGIALKVTDRALGALGGNPGQDPRWVFNREVRPHLVVTSSSHAFAFNGATAQLDRDLVRHMDHLEAETARSAFGRAKAERGGLELELLGSMLSPKSRSVPSPDAATKGGAPGDGPGGGGGGRGSGRPRNGTPARKPSPSTASGEKKLPFNLGGGGWNNETAADRRDDDGKSISGKPMEGGYGEDKRLGDMVLRVESHSARLRSQSLPKTVAPEFAALRSLARWRKVSNRGPAQPTAPKYRRRFAEVAAWKPDLVADANGRARFTFELPDNLTTWDVHASGATSGTEVGQGGSAVIATKPVILRVATPPFITSRDKVTVPVTLHSTLPDEATFKERLQLKDGDAVTLVGPDSADVKLPAHGRDARGYGIQARSAGAAVIAASATSPAGSDALETSLPVVAFGEPWRRVDVAALVDRCDFTLEVPDGAVAGSQTYQVIVQAGLSADVLEGLEYLSSYPYGCVEQTVNRFLAAVRLSTVLDAAGRAPLLDRDHLKASVRRGLARLTAFQNSDGGFGYWPGGKSSPWTTALGLEAILAARGSGFAVDTALLQGALNAAKAMSRKGGRDPDVRAALALALARAGDVDAGVLNGLFRDRRRLSAGGLARLVVAADLAGRPTLVQGAWSDLRSRQSKDAKKPFAGRRADGWPTSSLEATSLVLLAAEHAGAEAADTEVLLDAVRHGLRGKAGGTKAVAVAVEALGAYVAREGALRSEGDVAVLVDGKEVATGRLGGRAAVLGLEIPTSSLPAGKHRVTVTKSAGDSATCRLRLGHVRAADTVAPDGSIMALHRRVIAFQDPDRKVTLHAPGYEVVKPESRPRPVDPPALGQTVLGRKVTVELTLTAREDVSWVVIEDPLCAALDPIEAGVRGGVDRHERRASALVFFKNRLRKGETLRITYPCYAVFQGSFSVLAAQAHEMYAPERWGRSGSATLEVVPDVKMLAQVAPRKPTPDEIWSRARHDYTGERWDAVVDACSALRALDLREDVRDQVLGVTTRACLRGGKWAEAVKAREEIDLRNAGSLRLGRADRERLGRAYLEVKDALEARAQFQGVVLDGLDEELAYVKTLRGGGLHSEAVAHQQRTLLRYPGLPAVVAHDLTTASRLLTLDQAPKTSGEPSRARSLQRKRWQDALSTWRSVMAWHPKAAIAEEAGYRRVALLADLGLEESVINECRRYLARNGEAVRRADAVTFRLMAALFAQGKYADAKPFAQTLWDATWPRKAAKGSRSRYRHQAGYLLGRMAHVAGDYDTAVEWYGRVRQQVPDAQQSWLFFTRHQLAVDPVVRARTDADATIKLRAKNVEKLAVQVYPVDLGVLFAVKKSFDRLASADLSGLHAEQSLDVPSKLAKYADGEVSIPLGHKKRGAYLVVVQSGELIASTLLVVGEASVTVQRGGGAVRVYLVGGDGKPLRGATVRLGVAGRIFHTGTSDERGMLDVRDPGRGAITVVAEKGDQVAVDIHR
ncbi:MAG: hypothetical protein CMJ83_03560 [Planctomycetes bacterium]|nr:hypothetical protein [Planctomycetota bacterium]